MWWESVFKLPIFHYLFLFQVRKQRYVFPTWNLKKFISEMSWNSQLLWFLNWKQANPLCRFCSALFCLGWLKILCRRKSCGLKSELILSAKTLSSSACPLTSLEWENNRAFFLLMSHICLASMKTSQIVERNAYFIKRRIYIFLHIYP